MGTIDYVLTFDFWCDWLYVWSWIYDVLVRSMKKSEVKHWICARILWVRLYCKQMFRCIWSQNNHATKGYKWYKSYLTYHFLVFENQIKHSFWCVIYHFLGLWLFSSLYITLSVFGHHTKHFLVFDITLFQCFDIIRNTLSHVWYINLSVFRYHEKHAFSCLMYHSFDVWIWKETSLPVFNITLFRCSDIRWNTTPRIYHFLLFGYRLTQSLFHHTLERVF